MESIPKKTSLQKEKYICTHTHTHTHYLQLQSQQKKKKKKKIHQATNKRKPITTSGQVQRLPKPLPRHTNPRSTASISNLGQEGYF